MNRRQFLYGSTVAAAGGMLKGIVAAAESPTEVSIVSRGGDVVANRPEVTWAIGRLAAALQQRQVPCRVCHQLTEAGAGDICVLVGGSSARLQQETGQRLPSDPEAFLVTTTRFGGRDVSLAAS